jgi:hypothetical protein
MVAVDGGSSVQKRFDAVPNSFFRWAVAGFFAARHMAWGIRFEMRRRSIERGGKSAKSRDALAAPPMIGWAISQTNQSG